MDNLAYIFGLMNRVDRAVYRAAIIVSKRRPSS